MSHYKKRIDGRAFDETRPIFARVGVIKNADGSAEFKIGNTTALAAVYGPRELFPKFMQDPSKGILRVNYNMMPFSGDGERVRPGPNRRAKEISEVTKKALLPFIDLNKFPNAVVDVFIELPETDAGSRCAGICAASMALAHAGIDMKDLVGAVSCGHVGGQVIVDLNGEEEHIEGMEVADVPVAMAPRLNKISLLQCDGFIKDEVLVEAIKKVKPAIEKIVEIQKKALKEYYTGEIK